MKTIGGVSKEGVAGFPSSKTKTRAAAVARETISRTIRKIINYSWSFPACRLDCSPQLRPGRERTMTVKKSEEKRTDAERHKRFMKMAREVQGSPDPKDFERAFKNVLDSRPKRKRAL
jgi:hypothetical protein